MSNFLQQKYVGKYRVLAEYDKETNDFIRDMYGIIDPSFEDVYIDCKHNCRINYMGNGVLQFYCPSLTRGSNVLKFIKEEKPNIYSELQDITKTDMELTFCFKWKYMDELEPYLKPRTKGKDISPFSSKNLPTEPYEIPASDMKRYKDITISVYNSNPMLIGRLSKGFLKTIKHDGLEGEQARRKSRLKIKEFVHSIGKWDEYMEYLKENINDE